MKWRTLKVTYGMKASRNEAGIERGVQYGLSCQISGNRISGNSVVNTYTTETSPIQNHTGEDFPVDLEQENDQLAKEEEQGEM
jgi:hypothetical protein